MTFHIFKLRKNDKKGKNSNEYLQTSVNHLRIWNSHFYFSTKMLNCKFVAKDQES